MDILLIIAYTASAIAMVGGRQHAVVQVPFKIVPLPYLSSDDVISVPYSMTISSLSYTRNSPQLRAPSPTSLPPPSIDATRDDKETLSSLSSLSSLSTTTAPLLSLTSSTPISSPANTPMSGLRLVDGSNGNGKHHYDYTNDRHHDHDQPMVYNITQTSIPQSSSSSSSAPVSLPVVRVTLSRQRYIPGDTIRVLMDFTSAMVKCHRVAITLTMQEHTHERFTSPGIMHQFIISDIHESSIYMVVQEQDHQAIIVVFMVSFINTAPC
jgi:hypothetical protein